MDAPASKSKLIKGATGDWEVVIGMEVHAQVTTKAKLFSGASTEFGGEPNAHVSLIDAAMPGMLPVINAECVRQAVRTGLGLNAKINVKSVFDRKNYFYPDLPQGYQISQYKSPIVSGGEVIIDTADGQTTRIGIERIHLEQDAGKLLHDQRATMSLVDLNRSGVALMEIVSKPEIRAFDDAMNFLAKLRMILRYLGTCSGDMEKGHLRADVNVSVNRPGEPLGTRCEIKNLNSINFIGQAIWYELHRQIEILEQGGKIEQETRLYDPEKDETRSMRSKEEAHDYRYFPDPDLLPLEITQAEVDALKADLPELPDQKRSRFVHDYALSAYDAAVLVAERERADYFERMVQLGANPKGAANLLINEYMAQLHRLEGPIGPPPKGLQVDWSIDVMGPTGPAANTAVAKMLTSKEISRTRVKELLWILVQIGPAAEPVDVKIVVDHLQMKQDMADDEIRALVDDIIAKNPDKVGDAKTNPKAVGWFVGQVMKASGGKANPQAVNELLRKRLGL
ncbi:MAG TPA: Asp-tRNA(Asn)/Glu-tRNA(Gln) amidotransferase subunit GatB [Xanthobacteraceae bacterium]|nr:Asp-tRNA(Asn)/Glu-tRNA(Gln) amidotransferase subunit GatB [Xanthobacteraceae bacterium]